MKKIDQYKAQLGSCPEIIVFAADILATFLFRKIVPCFPNKFLFSG